jgi:hypothetical protein
MTCIAAVEPLARISFPSAFPPKHVDVSEAQRPQ